jgi:hypothetical protein
MSQRKPRPFKTAVVDVVGKLGEVRERSPLLVIEVGCRSSECPARETKTTVKDFDGQLLELVRTRGLRCPVCGGATVLHWARTGNEQHRIKEHNARVSVNAQMYSRDYSGMVNLAAIDDRLPLTPPEWWEK